LAIADKVPRTVDDTFRFRGEKIEKSARQVETAVGAPRALVQDCGGGGLAIVGHGDLLETVGTGVSATVLGGVESDHEVTWGTVLAAGAQSDIVEGPPRIVKTSTLGGKVSRSPAGNSIVGTAKVGTSVRVCCDVGNK
jgi:hypothetical protein